MAHSMSSAVGSASAKPFAREPFEVRTMCESLGQHIRTARVRRARTQDDVAAACGITRRTLSRLEQGDTGVSWGTVLSVLWVLGLLDSARSLADPDADRHGKILEAAKRPLRVRAEKLDNDF